MEPAALTARLAASAVAPLVRKLLVTEGPGAGLTGRPVRLSRLVSFTGEKRSLTERDLRRLAAELVRRAAESAGPREAPGPDEREVLSAALAIALHSLGDLDMDDVQAVALGPEALARRLTRPAGLPADTSARLDALLHTACLHILDFFSRRAGFVPRTLAEHSRRLDDLARSTDVLVGRVPSRSAEDAGFERRYAEHVARRHGELTIHGLDLDHAREWRLDSAYVPLEATGSAGPPMTAERALAGRERVLLRGAAGSGKTTLVQWLAVTTARQGCREHLTQLLGRVPFVLPLRRVLRDGHPPAPDEFLPAVRSSLAGAQPAGWADRVLSAGRGLLLVDGLDEIPDTGREAVRRWLRELMGDFPGNMWLLTSRPSAVREDWLADEGFTELSLSPMAPSDVSTFVRRWHTAAGAGPELADALLTAVRASTSLASLAVNPLMCGLLCALHRERRGFLPHGRKDLYDAALGMLLERRDAERGIPARDGLRLSRETQVQLLQKLAHWMLRNDRAEMEHGDAVTQLRLALRLMAHVTAPAEQVFRFLLDRSGLLREPAHERVDFVHRTFQDHLAAKAVVEEGDFPLVVDNAHKADREDVVRMAVAHGRPAERARVLRGLLAPVPRETLHPEAGFLRSPRTGDGVIAIRNLLLAAACLEQTTELDPAVRAEVTSLTGELLPPRDRFLAGLLADAGPLVLGLLPGPGQLSDREAELVVITATRVATDAALPLLARYRDHPSLAVRRQLAWSWHRFDTRAYADEVLAHLDPSGLYFAAHSVEHLRVLRALGGRPRVQYAGHYRPHELVAQLPPDTLTHLWLRDGYTTLDGERWLDAFPRLRTLVLPGPPRPEHARTIPARVRITHRPDFGPSGED